MRPISPVCTGKVTSARSPASCAARAARPSRSPASASAAAITSFTAFSAAPPSRRAECLAWSGGLWLGAVDRRLDFPDYCREGFRLADRDVRQHLAVELEPGEFQPVHQLRIGQPMLAGGRIDALDPQPAKIALLVAAVAIGVAQRLFDLFERDAVGAAVAAAIALGKLQNLLVAGARR